MEGQQLRSPEEELAYLRAKVLEQEQALKAQEAPMSERATIINETIHAHRVAPAATVLHESYAATPVHVESAADALMASLNLGDSADTISRLQGVIETQGIKNALTVVEKTGDPKLLDDLHRYLVRYIAAGLPARDAREDTPRFKALRMTLYEVALPEPKVDEHDKPLKELLSGMEQLYAGLLSMQNAGAGEPGYFALELAVPSDKPELQFYAAVPTSKASLFEKQVLGIFPNAHLSLQPADYNVFAPGGVTLVSSARLVAHAALPLKDYTEFDIDPLQALTTAFSKIQEVGEGAALQIIVEPRASRHVLHYQKILHALRKGEKRDAAFSTPETVAGEVLRDFSRTIFSSKPKDEQKAKEAETRQIEANKTYIEQVEKKVAAPIVGCTIRIVASSSDATKSTQILDEIEAVFHQFGNTQGNRLEFVHTPPARASDVLEEFSFRLPAKEALPLSLKELTTIYHYPPRGMSATPHLKQSRFTHAPLPLGLPSEGALLGINTYRGTPTPVYMLDEDRLRHLYVIGQTGTGKTGLLKSLIIQDIHRGEGCCFIDPHGSDILDILGSVPPERYQDVIYFDPADLTRPFGLNFLEYDQSRPEHKTFIVNELLMIFRRLYGDVPESMGPAFEQYFRNATQLVMEDPTSGSTILDIARVLSNAEFRRLKLSRSMNPIVNQFWQEIATKAGGDASLENIVPYITNKFDDFTANDFIRPIVGQQESSFTFREVMDNKKILLVNLSKGRLGEKNANLIGLIVVGKLFMAALSRADNPRAPYPPFYLYIDEFQNITTDSIPGILSEARKYKLSLSVAHQFLSQVDEKMRGAIFGNVGNMAIFRVGEEDAEFFEKQFAPVFSALDFTSIENRNAYVKILSRGVPQKPFDLKTPDLPPVNSAQIADLMQLSGLTYGRDRAMVENMIRERYLTARLP